MKTHTRDCNSPQQSLLCTKDYQFKTHPWGNTAKTMSRIYGGLGTYLYQIFLKSNVLLILFKLLSQIKYCFRVLMENESKSIT